MVDTARNYAMCFGLNVKQSLMDNVLTFNFTRHVTGSIEDKHLFSVSINFNNKDPMISKTVISDYSTVYMDDMVRDTEFFAEEISKQMKDFVAEVNNMTLEDFNEEYVFLQHGLYFTDSLMYDSCFNDLKRAEFPLMENESEKQRVFFDMDGVVAEFNKKATMEEVFSEGYFKGLNPMQSSIDIAKALQDKGYEVFILSKSRGDKISEKIEWLKEYMPFIKPENICFVPLNGEKKNFIYAPRESDILIDDYNPNLLEWHGIAVKGINGINTYTDKFYSIDISFYKLYEDYIGNYDEIKERIDTAINEIDYYADKGIDFETEFEQEYTG